MRFGNTSFAETGSAQYGFQRRGQKRQRTESLDTFRKESPCSDSGAARIEWEQKGTHEQHLSVLDYKKQERAKEVAELDREIEGKQLEVKGLKATAEKIKEATDSLDSIEHQLDNNPGLQLPEPQGLMSAKSYKKKFVDPLIQRLKNLVRSAVTKKLFGLGKLSPHQQSERQIIQRKQKSETRKFKVEGIE